MPVATKLIRSRIKSVKNTRKITKAIQRPMRAFVFSARTGIVNKFTIKILVQFFVYEVVENSIAYNRLMDSARLWIRDIEDRITPVLIGFVA